MVVHHSTPDQEIYHLIESLRRYSVFLGGELHLAEQALHKRYGSVVRMGPNSLSFSSLSAFEAIYGYNKSLEKGDFYSFSRESYTGIENVFSARTDSIHREKRRKIYGPALSTSKVAHYEPAIMKNVCIFISHLTEAHSRLENVSSLNVASYLHLYTLNTILEIIYGEPESPPSCNTPESHNLLSAFKKVSKSSWGSSLLPWLSWLKTTTPYLYILYFSYYLLHDLRGNPTSLGALIMETKRIVFMNSQLVIRSRQSSILKNFLQVPNNDTKRMHLNDIWRECFNLTFAGPGSTAAALTAILYNLGTHQGREWQNRIHAETNGEPEGSAISHVLVAVIKETMRLHAPFPSAFPRTITRGAESVIPELAAPLPVGTNISSNTFVLGRSKELWGDDAEEWKPQRWLVGDESEKKRELDDNFVAFSKGPRSCMGREIAMLMLARAVAGVLTEWEIGAVGGPLKGKSYLEMQYVECNLTFVKR